MSEDTTGEGQTQHDQVGESKRAKNRSDHSDQQAHQFRHWSVDEGPLQQQHEGKVKDVDRENVARDRLPYPTCSERRFPRQNR